MMFCPKCEGLLMPKGEIMKCSCGYVQKEGRLTEKSKKEEIKCLLVF